MILLRQNHYQHADDVGIPGCNRQQSNPQDMSEGKKATNTSRESAQIVDSVPAKQTEKEELGQSNYCQLLFYKMS